MAFILARQFELLVARVEVAVGEASRSVKLQLYQHDALSFGNWSWSLPAPGEMKGSEADTLLRLQTAVIDGLGAALSAEEAETVRTHLVTADLPRGTPIWLHLVKPYGGLGALAWEERLEAVFDRPVLRLPDFTERPPENVQSLDVAVCCDISDAPQQVERAVRLIWAILEGSPRQDVQIYAFAPPLAHKAFRAAFAGEPRIWVAPAVRTTPTDSLPWIDNVTRALAGRSIDYLHLVARAEPTLSGPGLALRDPVSKPKVRARVRLCSPQGLKAALTTLGAWAAGVSHPEEDAADHLLRQFADALAQARPGAVIFADTDQALRESCRFVFSPTPVGPPRQGTAMIYAHPSRVPDQVVGDMSSDTAVGDNTHLFEETARFVVKSSLTARMSTVLGGAPPQASTANTPSWLAATQRFVESATLDSLRASSTDALNGVSWSAPDQSTDVDRLLMKTAPGEEAMMARSTLSDIQAIVADYAISKLAAPDE